MDVNEFANFEELNEYLMRQIEVSDDRSIFGRIFGVRGQIADPLTGYFIDFDRYENDFKKGLI